MALATTPQAADGTSRLVSGVVPSAPAPAAPVVSGTSAVLGTTPQGCQAASAQRIAARALVPPAQAGLDMFGQPLTALLSACPQVLPAVTAPAVLVPQVTRPPGPRPAARTVTRPSDAPPAFQL